MAKIENPEPPSALILPEEVASILQFAHACSKGIITPEELGIKLVEFEKWLDSNY